MSNPIQEDLQEDYHRRLEKKLLELIALPKETEWVEFKLNQTDPQEIGEYLSALSNSAALHKKLNAFICWGIENETHQIIGTNFRPTKAKKGNEELENWLLSQLNPQVDFQIYEGIIQGKQIAIFEIQAAYYRPISFRGQEYIRIGSYKKRLLEYPEKARSLWRLFEQSEFEKGIAFPDASSEKIFSLLDCPKFLQLLKYPQSLNPSSFLERLSQEKIIISKNDEKYDITNLGAILFAKDLRNFNRLARKALRIIIYDGNNRIKVVKEHLSEQGYGAGFVDFLRYLNDNLPQNEQIGQALRQEVRIYPEIAIRELVANALIHQDFSVTGASPTVEIFANRMEITNPGLPLIDTLRFIDEPPRSRNESIASLMRRMGFCEERGSGIDKVIFSIETYQLPAPDFRKTEQSTVVVLFAPKALSKMDREERIRACYQHTCLQYVSDQRMTNSSLRTRLGIKDSNYPMVSRIIKDTLLNNLIKSYNEETSRKKSSYVPFWA
jgi:ATP-dependent DNA helicase RecG